MSSSPKIEIHRGPISAKDLKRLLMLRVIRHGLKLGLNWLPSAGTQRQSQRFSLYSALLPKIRKHPCLSDIVLLEAVELPDSHPKDKFDPLFFYRSFSFWPRSTVAAFWPFKLCLYWRNSSSVLKSVSVIENNAIWLKEMGLKSDRKG